MQATARFTTGVVPRIATQINQQVRTMSSHGSVEDNMKGLQLWTYATYAALPGVIAFGYWTLSHGHEHGHDGPHYPYLKKRDRKFPWGTNCDLFDFNCGKQEH